jgi:uncharacterized protein YkwD
MEVKDIFLLQIESRASLRNSLVKDHVEIDHKFPSMTADHNVTLESLIQEADEIFRSASPSARELQHFENIKAERAKGYKCPDGTYFGPNSGEFKWDCRLWRAGRLWSQRMGTERFEGHSYKGSTSCKRTEAQGFPKKRGCGENLALGQATSEEAIVQLKKSKEHCKNFFEPTYNKLGVGFFENPGAKFRYYWTDSFGAWHQDPDQSCIGGSPAPTPAPGCADIDTFNCQYYKSQGLCTKSQSVMAQCKDTCGIGSCGSSSSSCQDTAGSCDYYKTLGYCSKSKNVKEGCKKTCGLCPTGSSSPIPQLDNCRDTAGSCDYYRSKGYCSSSKNVQDGCKKTCGLCATSCADTASSCGYYRSKGYCQTSKNVKTECKKTCGFC